MLDEKQRWQRKKRGMRSDEDAVEGRKSRVQSDGRTSGGMDFTSTTTPPRLHRHDSGTSSPIHALSERGMSIPSVNSGPPSRAKRARAAAW